MTVDERIEALTRRHEALRISLEQLGREIRSIEAPKRQDAVRIRALLSRLEGDAG